MPDLKAAREAALAVLKQVQRWSRMLSGMRNPYAEGARDEGVPSRPTLGELLDLRTACAAASNSIPDSVVGEVAGFVTPSGVRSGGAYFASAHELAVSIANATSDYLEVIIPETATKPSKAASLAASAGDGAKSSAVAASGSAPQDAIAKRWSDDSIYYRQLLWDIAAMVKTVAVPRVRMLLDCESAQALRHRQLVAALTGPSAKVTAVLPTKSSRPNLNPFSPSTKPSVFRLLRSLARIRRQDREGDIKKMAVYKAAGLKGQAAQRAVDAALEQGLLDSTFHLTSAGAAFLAENEPPRRR